MKQLLLTFLFLACGATAMAKADEHIGPPAIEKVANITAASKKIPAKTVEKQVIAKPAKQTEPARFCSTVDGSRFSLSVYIVDIVNSGNLKVTKMLLTK